jgi:hypothetical protein
VTKTSFEAVRKEFGRWSTWAIWNKEQSKIDDTSVIEQAFKTNFSLFRPGIIFIGLNVSKDVSARDWLNFHTRNRSDYNLRQLLIDTPYSGAYITDIFKKEPEYTGKSFKYGRLCGGEVHFSISINPFTMSIISNNISSGTVSIYSK